MVYMVVLISIYYRSYESLSVAFAVFHQCCRRRHRRNPFVAWEYRSVEVML